MTSTKFSLKVPAISNKISIANSLARSHYILSHIEQRTISFILSKIKPSHKLPYDLDINIGDKIKSYTKGELIPGQYFTAEDEFTISAEDYAKEFNVTLDCAKKNLQEIYKTLPDKKIILDYSTKSGTFHWISFIEYDKETNILSIFFSPQIIPFICQLTSYFVTAAINEITAFSNKYSYNLYLNLKSRFDEQKIKSPVEFSLEELYFILEVRENSLYRENFGLFNQNVLSAIISDLKNTNYFANLSTSYVKSGRKVTGINFILAKSRKISPPGPDYL